MTSTIEVLPVKGSGFEEMKEEVFISWDERAVCLHFIAMDDGWQEFDQLMHPDEAEALGRALVTKAEVLRGLWKKNGGPPL
jgi:hypothetical protein